jgi:hypothetical protein
LPDAALARFRDCMRANRIAGLPKPEGGGFNVIRAHIDQATPRYKAAQARCDPMLQATAFYG